MFEAINTLKMAKTFEEKDEALAELMDAIARTVIFVVAFGWLIPIIWTGKLLKKIVKEIENQINKEVM